MKTTNMTTAQLKQAYEALFGIQGNRIDNLSAGELLRAVRDERPHWKCPARGSATNRKSPLTPADYARIMGSK